MKTDNWENGEWEKIKGIQFFERKAIMEICQEAFGWEMKNSFIFVHRQNLELPDTEEKEKKKKHLSLGCKGNVGDLCPYTKKISYISKATIFVLSNESNYSFWLMFYKGMCLFEVDASDRK